FPPSGPSRRPTSGDSATPPRTRPTGPIQRPSEASLLTSSVPLAVRARRQCQREGGPARRKMRGGRGGAGSGMRAPPPRGTPGAERAGELHGEAADAARGADDQGPLPLLDASVL